MPRSLLFSKGNWRRNDLGKRADRGAQGRVEGGEVAIKIYE